VKFQVPELGPDAITVRRLTAGEAAMIPVRLQSDRGVNEASAKTVVVEARRLAAPYPNDPGAQIALAEAEYDAGNDDAAQAAADRALAEKPTDRTAMEYEGMARVRRLRMSGGGDAKAWQEARSWFIRANHLEPNDGWALERFYRSFLAEGIAPTKSAVAGLEVAYSAVPQDAGLRMMLATQYLHDGKKTEARQLLAPLAFDPHAPPDNPARKMIALIDRDDSAAIATALRSGKLEEDDAGDENSSAPGGKDDGKPGARK
jgi:tetratricopeptide (TPR) repeat protein